MGSRVFVCACVGVWAAVCVSQNAEQSMGHFDNGRICCKICLAFKPKLGFVHCAAAKSLSCCISAMVSVDFWCAFVLWHFNLTTETIFQPIVSKHR